MHERLDDHRGDRVLVLRERVLQGSGVTGRHSERVEQRGSVERVEEIDAADGDRADGVAVVGVLEGDEARSFRTGIARLLPVLKRHLERDFDGGRAGVGEEDMLEARAALSVASRPASSCPGGWERPEHGAMRDPVELARTAASMRG